MKLIDFDKIRETYDKLIKNYNNIDYTIVI